MDAKFSKGRACGRMFLRAPGILTILGMLFTLIACRQQTPAVPRILKKGDNLNGMVVTSGMAHAPFLEAYCIFDVDEESGGTIDCQVPPLPKLAIGHMIGVTGRAFQELDWSKLVWQVYLDGYLLDLDTFDVETSVEPALGTSPSPVREVFKHRKTWDIVLTNPTVGMHTLLCTAKTGSVVYNWLVNFTIGSTPESLSLVGQSPVKPPAGPEVRSRVEGMERRTIASNH